MGIKNHIAYNHQEQKHRYSCESADNNTGGFEPHVFLLVNSGVKFRITYEPSVIKF